MVTSQQTAKALLRWIHSCYTYQQLATCEALIGTMLIERFPQDYVSHYITYLSGVLQVRRVELAMIPPQVEGQIKLTLCTRHTQIISNNPNPDICN